MEFLPSYCQIADSSIPYDIAFLARQRSTFWLMHPHKKTLLGILQVLLAEQAIGNSIEKMAPN